MDDEASKPLIRGEKVWLRGYTEDDLEPYERFVNSKDALWAGFSTPIPEMTIRNWYETRVLTEHGTGAYYFVVSPLGSRDFLGTTWVWNQASRIGGAEFSIYMADSWRWGTGLGTDAGRATTDFVFGFTEIDRLWLATDQENLRAQRSFEKVGFQQEGVIRHYTLARGEPVNAVLMGMLRDDWKKLDRPRSWDYD